MEGGEYSCDHCDFEAAQRGHLTKHINSKHEAKKYQCVQCDYKATCKDHFIVIIMNNLTII